MGNFLLVDEDPLNAVNQLYPYIIHIQAKDFVLKHDDKEIRSEHYFVSLSNRLYR